MDKEAMNLLISESLTRKLGEDCHVFICQALKTNLKRDVLRILQKEKNITPSIDLEPFYEELEQGKAIEDVSDHILQLYFHSMSGIQNFDVTPIKDFSFVKGRLYVELINRHSNVELLQDVPHLDFLDDFAAVVRCLVCITPDERANFLVHDNHLKIWAIDKETLLSIAIQNTRDMFGVDLKSMDEILTDLTDICPEKSSIAPVWVLSNRQKLSGAATALFDDVLKAFADTHGSFYAIFSSVHEVLLIPADNDTDIHIYTEMNQAVNAEHVLPEEILGTKAYYYDSEKGFIY